MELLAPSIYASAPATIVSDGAVGQRVFGFQWGEGDDAARALAILWDDPREAGPAQIARWARGIARECDKLIQQTEPKVRISVQDAFSAAEARSKLASHPHVDMCRVGRPGNMMAVVNEMKKRISVLQDRGVSVYAVKQENDYGAETWYKLMTDVPAEDAEGAPREAGEDVSGALQSGGASSAPQGAPTSEVEA